MPYPGYYPEDFGAGYDRDAEDAGDSGSYEQTSQGQSSAFQKLRAAKNKISSLYAFDRCTIEGCSADGDHRCRGGHHLDANPPIRFSGRRCKTCIYCQECVQFQSAPQSGKYYCEAHELVMREVSVGRHNDCPSRIPYPPQAHHAPINQPYSPQQQYGPGNWGALQQQQQQQLQQQQPQPDPYANGWNQNGNFPPPAQPAQPAQVQQCGCQYCDYCLYKYQPDLYHQVYCPAHPGWLMEYAYSTACSHQARWQ